MKLSRLQSGSMASTCRSVLPAAARLPRPAARSGSRVRAAGVVEIPREYTKVGNLCEHKQCRMCTLFSTQLAGAHTGLTGRPLHDRRRVRLLTESDRLLGCRSSPRAIWCYAKWQMQRTRPLAAFYCLKPHRRSQLQAGKVQTAWLFQRLPCSAVASFCHLPNGIAP